ncbi:MAG: PQQ-binding-like beta-propeller repeat protein [Dokdonella sp.]
MRKRRGRSGGTSCFTIRASAAPGSPRPCFDPGGNVFEAVGELVSSTGSQGVTEVRAMRTLYKLDANTGAVLWRQDTDGGATDLFLQIFPQAFSLVGSDVLLHAPFLAGSQDTLRRISGTDGSVQWASTQFHDVGAGIGDRTYPIDAGREVVFAGTSGSVDWAALDVDTGATSWASNAVRPSCAASQCSFSGQELLQSNGDLLTSGELGFAPSLRRYHNDGSGLVESFTPGSGSSTLLGILTNLWKDADGALRVYLYQGFNLSRGSIRFLSTFDFNAASLLGKQAIYGFDPGALTSSYPEPLGAPLADRMLVSTLGSRSSTPATSGIALLDTSVSAHGNLAVALSLDHASVQAGETLGFHLTASYSGDVPLSAAHMFALVPWQGGVTSLNCSGSNCVLDTRTGNVSATFDIAPGGSVDITGQVRVLDHSVYPGMYARTWGPLGLSEQDILDNFAQVTVTQSLFANGFDE